MAKPRTMGNMIAPPRFVAFVVILGAAAFPASLWLHGIWVGIIAAFDVAAVIFLISTAPLLRITDAARIEALADENDANRPLLLALTGLVTAVLLIAVGT